MTSATERDLELLERPEAMARGGVESAKLFPNYFEATLSDINRLAAKKFGNCSPPMGWGGLTVESSTDSNCGWTAPRLIRLIGKV